MATTTTKPRAAKVHVYAAVPQTVAAALKHAAKTETRSLAGQTEHVLTHWAKDNPAPSR